MKVSLFVTCLVDQFHADAARATIRVLERLGIAYDVPSGQTCCGQPAFNSGFTAEARMVARHFVHVFGEAEVIVAPSGSCTAMARNHLVTLFEVGTPERAAAEHLATRVYELSEFLVDVAHVTDTGATFPHRVTFHSSCHLARGLGVRDAPLELLRHVRGLELLPLADSETCCGFGGTFAVKYPDISIAMGRDKVAAVERTRAEYVVACDAGCLLHIGGVLHRQRSAVRPIHLAEVLAHE